MKFEKTNYAVNSRQSYGTLSQNLKRHGYDIMFGISMTPLRLRGDDENEIKIKWNLALGSGRVLHYWFYTMQGWKISGLTSEVDKHQLSELIEESYIHFWKKFMNDSEHKDAIPNMVFAKRPTNVDGFHLESTLALLEAEIYNHDL